MRKRLGDIKTTLRINTTTEGEELCTTIKNIIKGGGRPEKIAEGGEKFYTVAQAGVLPEMDIRTNKLDMVMDAADKVEKITQAKKATEFMHSYKENYDIGEETQDETYKKLINGLNQG